MQTKFKKRIIVFSVLLAFLIAASIFKIASNEDVPTISVKYGKMIDELTKPETYAPDNNAALLINKALMSFKEELTPPFSMHNIMPIRIDQIHPKRLEHLKKWIKSNETSLTLTSQAVQKPYYWMESNLNPEFNEDDAFRHDWYTLPNLVNALIWRARLQEKENISRALSDLMLAYKTIDYITLQSFDSLYILHKIRERILKNLTYIIQGNIIDPELMKQTQDTLESQKLEDISKVIEILRLVSLDKVQRKFTDDGNGNGKLIIPKFSGFDLELWDSFIQDYLDYNEYKKQIRKDIDDRKITTEKLNKTHDLAQKISTRTPWELFNENKSSHGETLEKVGGRNYFVHDNCANDTTLKRHHETLCQHQAMISILAINRYKADKGHLPTSLEILAENGYIKKIPMDPYSDKPLIYKLTENGFILYSVGRDFTDDGGQYTEYESWSQTKKSGDYIFWPVFPKENETPKNTEMDSYFTDPNYDPNSPIY